MKIGIVAATSLLAATLFSMDLPTAPAGFSWKEIPEIKAAFLMPKGWHFKREAQEGTLALFITQEKLVEGESFSTGLTINVFRNAKPGSAAEYAKAFIAKMAADKHSEQTWARDVGSLRSFGCLVKDTDATGTVIVHTLMVANPKTGTLYLFAFEAPEKAWTEAWKKGEKIMDLLAIDDEV